MSPLPVAPLQEVPSPRAFLPRAPSPGSALENRRPRVSCRLPPARRAPPWTPAVCPGVSCAQTHHVPLRLPFIDPEAMQSSHCCGVSPPSCRLSVIWLCHKCDPWLWTCPLVAVCPHVGVPKLNASPWHPHLPGIYLVILRVGVAFESLWLIPRNYVREADMETRIPC